MGPFGLFIDDFLESFENRQQWEDVKKLKKLFQAAEQVMKKYPDLEAIDSMKQVLRKDNDITDSIEKIKDH